MDDDGRECISTTPPTSFGKPIQKHQHGIIAQTSRPASEHGISVSMNSCANKHAHTSSDDIVMNQSHMLAFELELRGCGRESNAEQSLQHITNTHSAFTMAANFHHTTYALEPWRREKDGSELRRHFSFRTFLLRVTSLSASDDGVLPQLQPYGSIGVYYIHIRICSGAHSWKRNNNMGFL